MESLLRGEGGDKLRFKDGVKRGVRWTDSCSGLVTALFMLTDGYDV